MEAEETSGQSFVCHTVGMEGSCAGQWLSQLLKGLLPAPKVPEEDTGDHRIAVRCPSISSTPQLPEEGQTAQQALGGAGCPGHLQLGPQVLPGECDCPNLT